MATQSKIKKMKPAELVEYFNSKYKVGDTIMWRPYAHDHFDHTPHTTKTKAMLVNEQSVVWVCGKVAYISIEPMFLKYE